MLLKSSAKGRLMDAATEHRTPVHAENPGDPVNPAKLSWMKSVHSVCFPSLPSQCVEILCILLIFFFLGSILATVGPV